MTTKCFDRYKNEITEGSYVSVQRAGVVKVYTKEDGELWFNPYPEKFGEQMVKKYFRDDIELYAKDTMEYLKYYITDRLTDEAQSMMTPINDDYEVGLVQGKIEAFKEIERVLRE